MLYKKPRSLISINDLSPTEIHFLLEQATEIEKNRDRFFGFAREKILALLFFEPSTRTYFSFASAMQRLDGKVIGTSQLDSTSIAKGESLEDTVRMLAAYADMLIVRHKEIGSLKRVADAINIPVINAGEGTAEHPTQTLSDLFTIFKQFGRLNITIGLFGDLHYGRTNHSLLLAAARFGAKFICIAPKELQMPDEYIKQAEAVGARIEMAENIEEHINKIDVLYVSRLQKERLPSHANYDELAKKFRVNSLLANRLPNHSIIMHPLPRINEITVDVDENPRAKYFEQAKNAVAMRMAILLFYFGLSN